MFASSADDVWGDKVSEETGALIKGLFGVPQPSSANIIHRDTKSSDKNEEKAAQKKSRRRQR